MGLCLVALLTACLLAGGCLGTVVFSGVLPHGDFAYDPTLVHNRNGSRELHEAALHFADMLGAANPDVILLSSPHGISSSEQFLFYANSVGEGSAPIGRDLHDPSVAPYDVRVSLPLGFNLTRQLVTALKKAAIPNVSFLSAFANAQPMPLGWGEVIPLALIKRAVDLNKTQLLVVTQPTRRNVDPVAMIPELGKLGAALFKELHGWPQRVAVVISGDLAHTHLASGPYGYSPSAAPFDAACGRWAQTLDSQYLTKQAARYITTALSCGYTGLVMLDGLLRRSRQLRWRPCLLAEAHPTYYGMMVATMTPTESPRQRGDGVVSQVVDALFPSQKPRDARPPPNCPPATASAK
eukprot:EG_transcript_15095